MNLDTSALSGTTGLMIVIALGLQALFAVIGLVALARTPSDRLVFGRKWPWGLLIVFINTIGTILFLALGRRPAPIADAPPATSATTANAVRNLYDGEQQ
ncbi:PLDc N-terminal domain-containing protein [Microbacterium sp. LWO12-1.2]|uniref:PLDc N-terminal domain-containing protein n=1 Tax=Microbacterium sp. LWO12-1.2 TaxID=3135261 RepID=UPI003425E4D6